MRANKNRRITIIECPNDISGMIDMAKIADIAIILVDASIGFEMETFEFLSLLRVSLKLPRLFFSSITYFYELESWFP